jgi:predicted DNA-binding protein
MIKTVKKRTNLYLRADQVKRLKTIGAMKGSSIAELVRQAIDKFLEIVEATAADKRKRRQ